MTAIQPYEAPVARRPLDLEDYIGIARRHSGWILGPLYAGFVISIVIAYCLPNVYEASAKLQIRPSQVSDNLIQTTVNQQLIERLAQIESVVTSRQSLSGLIQDPRLNLYPEERAKLPLEDVEDQMRKDIKVTMLNGDAATRRGVSVFSVSFSYRRRKEAQATVQALVTLFINQSAVAQREQQNTLKEVFTDELSQARADLEKKNQALTAFRKANDGRLPEQETMNMGYLASLQNQVSAVERELSRLANERLTLDTQLTFLKSQMAALDTVADESPAANSAAFRQSEEITRLNRQIDGIETSLQELRQIYKENYPDIRNYGKSLGVLKKKRDDLVAQQEAERAAAAAKPDEQKKAVNSKLIFSRNSIQGDIDKENALIVANQRDQEFQRKNQDRLNKEIEAYRARLAATSAIETQNVDLRRDAQAAADRYEKLQHNQDLVRENAELVSRGATEVLEQIDPPTVPMNPQSPKRPMIVGAGIALSLLIGLALAGVQEARDSSLKNLKDVRAYTNLPVLCSVPLLENTFLVKRKRRITFLAWAAAIIVGLLAVAAALAYYAAVIRAS
jgi:uncharacterized protein involved in exopolysaccharide biosynthesis